MEEYDEKTFLFITKYLSPLIKMVYPQKPMSFIEMEVNKK